MRNTEVGSLGMRTYRRVSTGGSIRAFNALKHTCHKSEQADIEMPQAVQPAVRCLHRARREESFPDAQRFAHITRP